MKITVTERFKIITADEGKMLRSEKEDVTTEVLYAPLTADISDFIEIDIDEEVNI